MGLDDAELRLMVSSAYPQTMEGNLAYAVDRMRVAEAHRDQLAGVLLMIMSLIHQDGAVTKDEAERILRDAGIAT